MSQYELVEFVEPAFQEGGSFAGTLERVLGVYDIEAEPREENNKIAVMGWAIPHYMQLVGEYMKSLEQYPNPGPANLTEFKK